MPASMFAAIGIPVVFPFAACGDDTSPPGTVAPTTGHVAGRRVDRRRRRPDRRPLRGSDARCGRDDRVVHRLERTARPPVPESGSRRDRALTPMPRQVKAAIASGRGRTHGRGLVQFVQRGQCRDEEKCPRHQDVVRAHLPPGADRAADARSLQSDERGRHADTTGQPAGGGPRHSAYRRAEREASRLTRATPVASGQPPRARLRCRAADRPARTVAGGSDQRRMCFDGGRLVADRRLGSERRDLRASPPSASDSEADGRASRRHRRRRIRRRRASSYEMPGSPAGTVAR